MNGELALTILKVWSVFVFFLGVGAAIFVSWLLFEIKKQFAAEDEFRKSLNDKEFRKYVTHKRKQLWG